MEIDCNCFRFWLLVFYFLQTFVNVVNFFFTQNAKVTFIFFNNPFGIYLLGCDDVCRCSGFLLKSRRVTRLFVRFSVSTENLLTGLNLIHCL